MRIGCISESPLNECLAITSSVSIICMGCKNAGNFNIPTSELVVADIQGTTEVHPCLSESYASKLDGAGSNPLIIIDDGDVKRNWTFPPNFTLTDEIPNFLRNLQSSVSQQYGFTGLRVTTMSDFLEGCGLTQYYDFLYNTEFKQLLSTRSLSRSSPIFYDLLNIIEAKYVGRITRERKRRGRNYVKREGVKEGLLQSAISHLANYSAQGQLISDLQEFNPDISYIPVYNDEIYRMQLTGAHFTHL